MWNLVMYPSTGAIPNVAWGKGPGALAPEERDRLRALAARVAEIAAAPVYAEKKSLWRRHNDLERPRPMLLGTFDPETIRRTIRRTLDIARGCAVEIILKDTMTFAGEPQRLEAFIRIAREEIDRSA